MASIENVESDSIGEYIYTSQSSTTFRIREVSLHSATAYPKAAWNSAEDSESFRAIANPAQVLALLQAHLHKLFTYITLETYPQETPKISPTTRSFDHLTSTTFYVPNHKVQLPKCHTMSSPPLKQTRPLAFILNVQMTIKSSDVGAFLAAIKPAYDAVLREPDCAFFNLGTRHPLNPLTGEPSVGEGESVISFSEGWNCTLDWFREVQLKKEYYGPYQAITQPMYTKPPAFEIVIPSEEFCHYKEGM